MRVCRRGGRAERTRAGGAATDPGRPRGAGPERPGDAHGPGFAAHPSGACAPVCAPAVRRPEALVSPLSPFPDLGQRAQRARRARSGIKPSGAERADRPHERTKRACNPVMQADACRCCVVVACLRVGVFQVGACAPCAPCAPEPVPRGGDDAHAQRARCAAGGDVCRSSERRERRRRRAASKGPAGSGRPARLGASAGTGG
jgi:hypothetical protein